MSNPKTSIQRTEEHPQHPQPMDTDPTAPVETGGEPEAGREAATGTETPQISRVVLPSAGGAMDIGEGIGVQDSTTHSPRGRDDVPLLPRMPDMPPLLDAHAHRDVTANANPNVAVADIDLDSDVATNNAPPNGDGIVATNYLVDDGEPPVEGGVGDVVVFHGVPNADTVYTVTEQEIISTIAEEASSLFPIGKEYPHYNNLKDELQAFAQKKGF
jgi:hypothetical protein